MKIEATPQEIAELLRAITSNQEQKVPNIQHDLTIDGNKVFCGSIDPQELTRQLHKKFEGIRRRSRFDGMR